MKKTVSLLREHLETIRINLEILEVVKLKGRITGTDKQYLEIIRLNQKNQNAILAFVLTEIPVLIGEDPEKNRSIIPAFLSWANDLLIRVSYLDRSLKEYMHALVKSDSVS